MLNVKLELPKKLVVIHLRLLPSFCTWKMPFVDIIWHMKWLIVK